MILQILEEKLGKFIYSIQRSLLGLKNSEDRYHTLISNELEIIYYIS